MARSNRFEICPGKERARHRDGERTVSGQRCGLTPLDGQDTNLASPTRRRRLDVERAERVSALARPAWLGIGCRRKQFYHQF